MRADGKEEEEEGKEDHHLTSSSTPPPPPKVELEANMKMHFQFAGQGQPVLEELRHVVNQSSVASRLCTLCTAEIQRVLLEVVAVSSSSLSTANGFPLDLWLKGEDLPPEKELLSASVSFPLITLVQLCHFAVYAAGQGGHEDVMRQAASAFGHSQGEHGRLVRGEVRPG